MTISSDLGAASRDLLLGASCVGCGRPGPSLCHSCGRSLEGLPTRVRPSPCPKGLPPVFAVAAYDGAPRAALIAHKEEARLSLAKPLGRALALSVFGVLSATSARPTVVHLVPAPSRPGMARERGHDPIARMLAHTRRALRSAGVVVAISPVLRVRRAVADQAGLSAEQRALNLADAFTIAGHRRLDGHQIIVADDIITTGATAMEATRAIEAAGGELLGLAVVAATARRGVGPSPWP